MLWNYCVLNLYWKCYFQIVTEGNRCANFSRDVSRSLTNPCCDFNCLWNKDVIRYLSSNYNSNFHQYLELQSKNETIKGVIYL